MDRKLKKQVQDFERQLDAALDALPTRGWSGTSTLRLASELHEIGAFKKGIDEIGYIDRGYSILANSFVSGADGAAADIESETDVRQMMDECLESPAKYPTISVSINDPLASLNRRLSRIHDQPSMLQPPSQSCTMHNVALVKR